MKKLIALIASSLTIILSFPASATLAYREPPPPFMATQAPLVGEWCSLYETPLRGRLILTIVAVTPDKFWAKYQWDGNKAWRRELTGVVEYIESIGHTELRFSPLPQFRFGLLYFMEGPLLQGEGLNSDFGWIYPFALTRDNCVSNQPL